MKKFFLKMKDNFEVVRSFIENVNWGSFIDKEDKNLEDILKMVW